MAALLRHTLAYQLPFPVLMLVVIASHALAFNSSALFSPLLLKDVVKAIARRERWDPEAVRLLGVDGEGVVVGRSRRHEFQVRVGKKTLLVFKFPEEVGGATDWRKPWKREGGSALRWLEDEPTQWPRPRLKGFDLDGPVEVKATGNDRFSLLLPMNTTYTGLKRILVGEGITMKVEGAEEVTLSYPYSPRLPLCRSLLTTDYNQKPFWLHGYSLCSPLLSVQISGSASLVAHKRHNSEAYIGTAFQFPDAVELLPEKCYSDAHSRPDPSASFLSLGPRLGLLEKILRSILGKQISQLGSSHFLKAKIIPSALVKFRIKLERDVGDDDRIWRNVPEWKTRPTMEQDQFDVLVRAEVGRGLKPLSIRKLTRPVVTVDSAAWSSLLSNISLTQLQSAIVPPEALTLDVKW